MPTFTGGSPLLWLVGGALALLPLFFVGISYSPNRVPRMPAAKMVFHHYLLILIASLTGRPATAPRARGPAGFVKCFPLGNSFPSLPPSVLSSVFETDLFPSKLPQNKNAPIGI